MKTPCKIRSFNAVFGKIGRIATADVIIQLLKIKCLPAMLYGVEVCALKKSQTESLGLYRLR